MGKNIKKIVEENKNSQDEALILDDKGVLDLTDISHDFSQFNHLTSVVLAHNRLTKITQGKLP